jgi:hypothetical protein
MNVANELKNQLSGGAIIDKQSDGQSSPGIHGKDSNG